MYTILFIETFLYVCGNSAILLNNIHSIYGKSTFLHFSEGLVHIVYNLEGKNIYLFCTSGGSSIDKSLSDMKALYPKLNFVKAQRIKLGSADADIEALLAK